MAVLQICHHTIRWVPGIVFSPWTRKCIWFIGKGLIHTSIGISSWLSRPKSIPAPQQPAPQPPTITIPKLLCCNEKVVYPDVHFPGKPLRFYKTIYDDRITYSINASGCKECDGCSECILYQDGRVYYEIYGGKELMKILEDNESVVEYSPGHFVLFSD